MVFTLLGCHVYRQGEAEVAIVRHQFTFLALHDQYRIFLDSAEVFNPHSANPSSGFQSLMDDVAFVIKSAHPRYVTVMMPSSDPSKPLQEPLMRERMNQVVAFLTASNTNARIISSRFAGSEKGPGLDFFTAHGNDGGLIEIAYGQ